MINTQLILTGLAQMVGSLPNPKTPMVLNYIIGQILELLDGDFKVFKKFMFSEDMNANILYMMATGASGGGSAPASNPMAPQQNQGQIRQSGAEQQVRGQ